MNPPRTIMTVGLAVLTFLLVASAGPLQATIHEVNIENFQFSPLKTTVNPGDTVRWTLISGTHTTTSLASSPKDWNSGTMNNVGETYDVVFTLADGPGPFPYRCEFHPATMIDTIFVNYPTPPSLGLDTVVGGLSQPILVASPPADSSRLFVAEKAGRIRIVENDSVLTRPFLDISDRVVASGSEQGLLGLAFHPMYPDSAYLYVNYTGAAGTTNISRFTVSSDPDSAIAASEIKYLTVPQPFPNHNAGMLAFGPNDGYLYFGLGDGGSAGDPDNRAQTGNDLLGKLHRIDINQGTTYAIPADNPFTGSVDTLDEIWALGLRNPWRWSFDRETGNLWMADVGQASLEEINFQSASSSGGENYGWRLKEGTECYDPSTGCDTLSGLTDPVYEYTHDSSRCAITGGYIYRGCAMPELNGFYFFGDYCTGEVWVILSEGNQIGVPERVFDLQSFELVSFGEDAYGELYIVQMGSGNLLKIVPDGAPSQCPGINCCTGQFSGNVDCDAESKRNLADITRLIDFVYLTHNPLCCPAEGNVDGDSLNKVNLSDITRLIDNVYLSHSETAPCG